MGATKAGSQRLASWIFGGSAFAFLIGVFIFGPDELPGEKQRILGIICAVLVGLFGYFFTGSVNLVAEGKLPKWGKVTIQASGGAALFVLVLWWCSSGYAPVKRIEKKINGIDTKVNAIGRDVTQIVEMLREELSIKNEQIAFLQDEVSRLRGIIPSERARQLAEQIPEDASSYALALKAIAQSRFEDARRFLCMAQEEKQTELAEIYRTRGETELYAGNCTGAADWYEKALELAADNRRIWEEAGVVFMLNAEYEKAEPLMRRAREIDENSLGRDHPSIAYGLSNLAGLLKVTDRVKEARRMYERALEIFKESLGSDHPDTQKVRRNLESLEQAASHPQARPDFSGLA